MRRGLAYEVPLDDFAVQIVLPSDLSQDEAKKLAAAISTLVIFQPPSDERHRST